MALFVTAWAFLFAAYHIIEIALLVLADRRLKLAVFLLGLVFYLTVQAMRMLGAMV